MKTNIFVPSKINVGFQNRQDTYTGKLAYVIYFDEKGKLRKETSWNGWRDENIPNEIYENEPTEGFVLNKKVGGNNYSWNPRQTYTRVYDPRGFEFEITIPNLLWILENCNCIKGKGLEGQFVYGWDGKELVLVPVESPDYKEIQEKNKIIHNNEFIKAKDLILGATYETLNGERYVYMGKYDMWDVQRNSYNRPTYWNRHITEGWSYPIDDTWIDDAVFGGKDYRFKNINIGKHFWFIRLGNNESKYSLERDKIVCFKSITRKFSKVITTDCEKYPEYYDMLEHSECFSPIDYSKNKIIPVEFYDFVNLMTDKIQNNKGSFVVTHLVDGRLENFEIHYKYKYNNGINCGVDYYYIEKQPLKYSWMGNPQYNEIKHIISLDQDYLKKLYKMIQPMYGEQYLENGNLYKRRGYYGTEE